jgi:hypothetical protein
MTITAARPIAELRSAPSNRNDSEQHIRQNVQRVLSGLQAPVLPAERRREKRHPFPYPVYLTPVARGSSVPAGDTIVVLGKHLSELGFDFYHRDPLPHRRAILSFEAGRNAWLGLLIDLSWCRFGRHGWYDNGGRFLAVVPSPLADDSLPSLLH